MLSEKELTGDGSLASQQHFLYLNLKDNYSLEKRKFRPHITIARIRRKLKNFSDILLSIGPGFYESKEMCYSLDNPVLFESVLKPESAVYSPVYTVKLQG